MTCSALQPPSLHRILAPHEGDAVKSSSKPRRAINAGFIAITLTIAPAFAAATSGAAELKPETIQAFNEYIQRSEARMAARQPGDNSFLWMDALPPQGRAKEYADLKQGQLVVQRSEEGDSSIGIAVAGDGLIHDWTGIVFVPGVTLAQTLALLEDYDRVAEFYRPDVNKSKLLSRSGDDFRVYLRLTRKEVITAVFDTEYDIHYTWLDAAHAQSRSYSTRIAEVERAGESGERDKPAGKDNGFLWRLYSYWRFCQADGGVYIQCEAISLTREVPAGLRWAVGPFITRIPSESLRRTLESTRSALRTFPKGEDHGSANGSLSSH
jgi:hypothetical protein